MHLSAAIPRGRGGGTLGTYVGMGRDLFEGLDCFCSATAILEIELETSAVPVCEMTGYVGKHVLISPDFAFLTFSSGLYHVVVLST